MYLKTEEDFEKFKEIKNYLKMFIEPIYNSNESSFERQISFLAESRLMTENFMNKGAYIYLTSLYNTLNDKNDISKIIDSKYSLQLLKNEITWCYNLALQNENIDYTNIRLIYKLYKTLRNKLSLKAEDDYIKFMKVEKELNINRSKSLNDINLFLEKQNTYSCKRDILN